MTFYYYLSYDEKTDEFFAMVDDGAKDSTPLYTIDDTDEMIDLITTNVMKHVDDVDGLHKHLCDQGFLKMDDDLIIVEKALI